MTSAAPAGRPAGCPSDLALDELAAGDLAGTAQETELRGHVAGCARCARRSAARLADPVLAPDPRRLGPLLHPASSRPRRRWLRIGGATMGAAAAVFSLLLWRDRSQPQVQDGEERAKGSLVLTVHVQRAGADGRPATVEPINGQGRLRAGEEMRFTITSARPGYAVVLGLDEAPSVTTYVPAPGSAGAASRIDDTRAVTLPGSVIADDRMGIERVVAIVCDAEPSVDRLRHLGDTALAHAGGHPERVASLESGCAEASVVLHKEPR